MSEAILNQLARHLVDLTLCKSRYDLTDVQWYTERPFWRRTNMKFSRQYKILPDYEIGDKKHGRTLKEIREEAEFLGNILTEYEKTAKAQEMQRAAYLRSHAESLLVRTRMLLGESFSFNEMTQGLYNLTAPAGYQCNQFDTVLEELCQALPGEGSAQERADAFRKRICIPKDRLLAVLTAVTECFHSFSMQNMHITGNSSPRLRVRSLPDSGMVFISILFGYDYDHIQYERNFNLAYPWTVDNVLEYTGHEMEPGHLTYYEKRLQTMIDTGWPEMGIVSLYSPSSAFTEGSARYAAELCFAGSTERKKEFIRELILKPAGMDEGLAEIMPLWQKFVQMKGYAALEVSRKIWDGQWTYEEGLHFMQHYGFAENGQTVTAIEMLMADPGHYVCHDYARDVTEAYFKSASKSTGEQWELYEKLCCSHMSMEEIKEKSFQPAELPGKGFF